ncbi:CYTH domain-containing protein [Paludibacterium denitrificans]|uniref:CYTH domain-containing protein n=1 Tax=Paludibacterium denitrificans TaxID=2675226 RepID=A0A844GBD9_9NEIS|nr:CYTH domain-containing protein [Paludibacterium denitrificans]MTD33816.1 CYTH domain-containing protein [Paludibacterium denitrificans]
MHFETELKLRLAPQKNAAFRRLMATHAPAPSRKHIVSHYYDTATLELARYNMALSLRRQDGQWVQAIHLDDTAGSGLHQRLTFEAQVASQAIDLANITDEATRRFLLQDKIARALRPLFTTDVQRTKWHLEDENGNELEVVLDHGTIVGDTQTHKINEVKLGLRQGQASALFDLALALGKHFSMMPEPLSKVAQGHLLNQLSHQTSAIQGPITQADRQHAITTGDAGNGLRDATALAGQCSRRTRRP